MVMGGERVGGGGGEGDGGGGERGGRDEGGGGDGTLSVGVKPPLPQHRDAADLRDVPARPGTLGAAQKYRTCPEL